MNNPLSAEQSAQRIAELEIRLEEAEQLIDAIKAGEVDAFALTKDNQPQIFTLESGDYGYRMLVENFGEGALTLSEEGLIIYTNDYFHDLLDLSYNDVIGKSVFNFIHPESKEAFAQLFKKGLTEQSKGEINLCGSNKEICVYISLTSLFPKLQTVGMIVTDLTEKKQQEATLRQQNKELTHTRNFIINVLQSTNHGVLSYAAIRKNGEVVDFEILYANEPAFEQLNLPAEKVLGKTYLAVMPQAKRQGLWERVIRVLSTGKSEAYEVSPPHLPERSFLVKYTPLEDGVTCTFIEITEQKTRERELQEKNEMLEERNEFVETLINASMDLVMVFDPQTTILQANKKAIELYASFYPENIIGKRLSDIAPQYPLKDIASVFATGKTLVINGYQSLLGNAFFEVTFIPLFKKNKVYAVMVITHDITDIMKKQEELEKMNKELQSFAYISSHDLQEPLRKIQIFVTRIIEQENQNFSEKVTDMLNRMQAAAQRMQTLIDDLLAYSRTNTSRHQFEHIDLHAIIAEVEEDLKEEMDEKNASIEATQLCPVYIIPFQFRQMMHNLIGNSLKFSKPDLPPHIQIASKIELGINLAHKQLLPQNSYCHISVTDNGIGFEQEFSEKIFELFQRLHDKTQYQGTGIGLAIVKRIVENHQGFISVKSEINQGTRFDIYIPAP